MQESGCFCNGLQVRSCKKTPCQPSYIEAMGWFVAPSGGHLEHLGWAKQSGRRSAEHLSEALFLRFSCFASEESLCLKDLSYSDTLFGPIMSFWISIRGAMNKRVVELPRETDDNVLIYAEWQPGRTRSRSVEKPPKSE